MSEDFIKVLNEGYVRLIDVMGNDLSVVNSARVSFDKSSELSAEGELLPRDKKLLSYLWKEGHTSPFRHATLTFEVYAPLMVARQHWKHNVASTYVDDQNGWNESSRRYVTEDPEFYIPWSNQWRHAPENAKQGSGSPIEANDGEILTDNLIRLINASTAFYDEAIKMGVAVEQARLFLPAYSLYVRYRWTISLHGLMHFIELRNAHGAQREIAEYSRAFEVLAKRYFPESLELIND